ncbi:EamA family transporter [Candidatus Woesearchaeota archaeon]|nr:EamA family transporter [Candidatus Woesearchaeota archaeon]
MATKRWAIGLVVVCTLFTSFAQIFYKFGADRLSFDIFSIITNWPIIIGIALYGTAAVLLIISLKAGEVSVLYPIIATSYIWVSLLSMYFFGEIINFYRWIGMAFIFLGVILVAKGGRKDSITFTEPV